ncbi:hypothetical protein SASPL_135269 [Salvia splendens]|uniref:Isopenicillin N synthase-like Fe(2+) 2OG dioxygenase domain-containing protein n=1 Tax=Salvia splendens TaxID=180675 RepID=A0A8X8ZFM1_SALSN|nr:hypothetical protein SASPL_135269 [Salvia splendens]
MVASSRCSNGDYDWAKQVKQFDETKAGVKGLVDTGITNIPDLFVHPRKSLESDIQASSPSLELPTIDFGEAQRGGARRFHELPNADKAPFYTDDAKRRVRFRSNLPTRANGVAFWRDFLTCIFQDDQLDPEEIPSLREVIGRATFGGAGAVPRLPIGNRVHEEPVVGVSDSLGGLQILHRDQWVDVPPVRANIGDLMQIISNDKFISVEHRVLAQSARPRISVASFFTPSMIKEILSDENPAV